MVTDQKNVFSCATNFLRGKKCVFCGSFKINKTSHGYVKCRKCHKQKSVKKIRTEIGIVTGFYQQQPAYRLAIDLGVDYQTATQIYQKFRLLIYHIAELDGVKLSDEIEIDETYFGGRRKGKRVRGAAGKSIVFGLLERDRRVSKYHFPMYLKEMEYRFNHRNESLFKLLLATYFGYVSH